MAESTAAQDQPELQKAPEVTAPPRVEAPYKLRGLRFQVVTPAGFPVELTIDWNGGGSMWTAIKEMDASFKSGGYKPPATATAPPATPVQSPAPARPTSPGAEAVWVYEGEGPPKCSVHKLAGKWIEGTFKSGDRQGQKYSFWACPSGRDCKPKTAKS